MGAPGFWDDQERAQQVSSEHARVTRRLEQMRSLEADVDEYFLGRVAVGQRAGANGARLTVSKVLPAVKDGRFRVELPDDYDD